ncbi:MAG: Cys-Cys-COOH (seleno)protein SaoC [Syntrophomonas sp.]
MPRKKRLILLLLVLLCIIGCGGKDRKEENVKTIETSHKLFEYYLNAYKDKQTLLTGVNDINNDGEEDLIVIYKDSADANKMIAIWEEAGKVVISEPAPAPAENYRIEWRDIDDKAPVELIISGSKGVNVGYAIYRLEKGKFVNLFGEGMEDCC